MAWLPGQAGLCRQEKMAQSHVGINRDDGDWEWRADSSEPARLLQSPGAEEPRPASTSTSMLGAVFIVVNAALGAGLLNFPAAFRMAGGVAAGIAMQMVKGPSRCCPPRASVTALPLPVGKASLPAPQKGLALGGSQTDAAGSPVAQQASATLAALHGPKLGSRVNFTWGPQAAGAGPGLIASLSVPKEREEEGSVSQTQAPEGPVQTPSMKALWGPKGPGLRSCMQHPFIGQKACPVERGCLAPPLLQTVCVCVLQGLLLPS